MYNVQRLEIKKPEHNYETDVNGRHIYLSTAIADLAARKREAEDIVWKANNYIFKECECGTKLKFPQSYKGQEISCPHCGKLITVED